MCVCVLTLSTINLAALAAATGIGLLSQDHTPRLAALPAVQRHHLHAEERVRSAQQRVYRHVHHDHAGRK